jgi:glycosyltransferase involved in cell wall biosynthesis
MRVLFFNEGNLGTHIMGQGQLEAALRTGLDGTPGVEARFAGLTAMGRVSNALATRPLEPLARAGLDPHELRWHAVQSLRTRAQLRRELRCVPADAALVHSHSVALALNGLMRELPVALSLDTTISDWSSMRAWREQRRHAGALLAPSVALERRALRAATLVLAWTAWARRAAQEQAPGARVVEHHPGIDLDRYRPAERRPRTRPRVLFVGGRFAEKGGEDLLGALDGQLGESVELDLVTPAQVPERPGVRVHRLGPSDPRLLELQQQADVFCLPSHGDAAPWAVLEAMACGTPVLASRVGGIPDMLEQGDAGVLVAHARPDQLARALGDLLENERLRAELAARARARCERVYDARAQFAKLIELLGEASAAFTRGRPGAAARAGR